MDNSDFYQFLDKETRGAISVLPQSKADFYKVFKDEVRPEGVLDCIPFRGSTTYDLIPAGFVGLVLVSAKVVEIFKTNNISGWNTIPARVNGFENLEYYLLTIKGRCSQIDYSRSEKILKEPLVGSGKPIEALKGLYFEIQSWDGSDIFTPENSKHTFVTSKVRDLLIKNKITNLLLQKITEIEII